VSVGPWSLTGDRRLCYRCSRAAGASTSRLGAIDTVQYRPLGNTGLKLSALGFGAMRLPKDEDEAIRCMRHSIELGVNYVDTAPGYGESEVIVGKALKGIRDQVILSTKNPLRCDTGKGWRERLETSLSRMQTDYIDVYQAAHGLRWKSFEENFSQPGAGLHEARKAKEEGLIRHISFSFHDTPENLVKLVETGEFEGVTAQYNLLDRGNEDAFRLAAENGMGVVVMGPVGGGRLGGVSSKLREMIPGGARSTPELALRFVLSNSSVSCAISGMNTIEMVEENCATASREEALSEDERAGILAALEENKKLAELYCTACEYCMPCPEGVAIPRIFGLMNLHRVYGLTDHAKATYAKMPAEREKEDQRNLSAAACVECGECEPKCPQDIPIIQQLKETHETLAGDR